MPTYAFTRTMEQMRDMIGRKVGAKSDGQDLDAESSAIIQEAMHLRMRELQALGIQWHQVTPAQASVSLVAGTATASLSALTDFLFPISAMLVVGTSQQPVEIIGHRAYQAIQEKTEQGEPSCVYIAGGTAYLWPVPNANGTLKFTYEAEPDDLVSATALDMPIELLRSFAILCSFDLLNDFQLKGDMALRITAQVPMAERTIRKLTAERVDSQTVTPEWF